MKQCLNSVSALVAKLCVLGKQDVKQHVLTRVLSSKPYELFNLPDSVPTVQCAFGCSQHKRLVRVGVKTCPKKLDFKSCKEKRGDAVQVREEGQRGKFKCLAASKIEIYI